MVAAIEQLNKKQSPGKDGVPSEFYYECVSDLAKTLTQELNEGIRKGYMHDSFYDGVLSLLYQQCDVHDINNWKIIMNRISDFFGLYHFKRTNMCNQRQIDVGQFKYIVKY